MPTPSLVAFLMIMVVVGFCHLNVRTLMCLKMRNQGASRQEKQIISNSCMRSGLGNMQMESALVCFIHGYFCGRSKVHVHREYP